MKYYKLKISLDNYEERLNRTILFKETGDLDLLAFTILSIFNTLSYHLYKFKDDKYEYECEISINQAEEMGYPDVGKESWGVTLDMLKIKKHKFQMIYDFGANYQFNIEILDTIELKEIYRLPRVIDGVGYGIVEDGRDLLEDYFDGKPLEYPLLFVKRGKLTELDFNTFDKDELNKKLLREIAKIRGAYYLY